MLIAMTRAVSPALADCELSYLRRQQIDVDLARVQHLEYQQALVALGCTLISLPADSACPDSVFVEDVAVVLDELAVMTRPGAISRRAEVAAVAAALRPYRHTVALQEPATLDGGDVLTVGRTLFVGQGTRSNAEAVIQLGALLAEHGYTVHPVPTHDCLHLKSAVTEVADGVLLVQPDWVDVDTFRGFDLIEVHPDEPHAANAVRIFDSVVVPASFPLTAERLRAAGIKTIAVEVSELQKAEGAVTCCSLLFSASAWA